MGRLECKVALYAATSVPKVDATCRQWQRTALCEFHAAATKSALCLPTIGACVCAVRMQMHAYNTHMYTCLSSCRRIRMFSWNSGTCCKQTQERANSYWQLRIKKLCRNCLSDLCALHLSATPYRPAEPIRRPHSRRNSVCWWRFNVGTRVARLHVAFFIHK